MASQSMNMLLEMMKQHPQRLELSADTDFKSARTMNDMINAQLPLAQGVTCTPDKIAGVSVEKFTPETEKGKTVVLQIHGGSFVYGSLVTCRSYASNVCAATGLNVYTIDYRLAPEHKFPAGAEDCFAVYKELLKQNPESNIALLGESAGATFVLVVALMAKAAGIKMPSCICSFAPCVNLEGDLYPSRTLNINDPCVPTGIGAAMRDLYIDKNTDTKNPLVSPIYGDFTGFPPVKLVADKDEVLVDDTILLAKKLQKQNVITECEIFEGTFHTFPAVGQFTDEGKRVLEETVEFIHKYSKK